MVLPIPSIPINPWIVDMISNDISYVIFNRLNCMYFDDFSTIQELIISVIFYATFPSTTTVSLNQRFWFPKSFSFVSFIVLRVSYIWIKNFRFASLQLLLRITNDAPFSFFSFLLECTIRFRRSKYVSTSVYDCIRFILIFVR